jgi:hypothetical protein
VLWEAESSDVLDEVDDDEERREFFGNPQLYSPWLDTCTTSPASIYLAKLWLNKCLEHHKPCGSGAQVSLLPHRVIDLTNPQKPVLSIGNFWSDRYVTLSYKWGTSKRYVTDAINYPKHLEEIPYEKLPWTFKEAINVTHRSDIYYLWIDALCIFEGDTQDMEREIGSMDQAYQNSTLTIFAASGNDADGGLSSIRDPRGIKPCRLEIANTAGDETTKGPLYLTFDSYEHETYPLMERGWVLQEEIMSRRGLLFGSEQLSWRCLCGSSSEEQPQYNRVNSVKELGSDRNDRWLFNSPVSNGFNAMRLWLIDPDPMPDRVRWQGNNHFDQWYKVVERHTLVDR